MGEAARLGTIFPGKPRWDRSSVYAEVHPARVDVVQPPLVLFVGGDSEPWFTEQSLNAFPAGTIEEAGITPQERDRRLLEFGDRLVPLISSEVGPWTVTLSRVEGYSKGR